MIRPSIGRVVLYNPSPEDPGGVAPGDGQQAAIICYVFSDTLVNLVVFDPSGVPYARTAVYLLQEGNHAFRPFAEWMPYQKAVAKGEIPPTLHVEVPVVDIPGKS